METKALVEELLDLMVNDSENLERTMKLLTDDCVWVLEPGVTEYHGTKELREFVGSAMAARKHDETHKVEVLNCFFDNENVCVEYTHSMIATGKNFLPGYKGKVKPGALRYCLAYHVRDGKFDRVHEYINSPSVWTSFLLPIGMKYLLWQSMRKIANKGNETGLTKS